jgi:hypothetical protein
MLANSGKKMATAYHGPNGSDCWVCSCPNRPGPLAYPYFYLNEFKINTFVIEMGHALEMPCRFFLLLLLSVLLLELGIV